MLEQGARLKALLAKSETIAAPGCYDALTARLTEQAGFSAVYMTGAGVSAANGFPDFGLLTQTEMVAAAGVIARSVQVPVIADADTGYGNELNVTRTVRDYERVGVAAIHIEDQVSPKRCGHLDGKDVTSAEEFVSKIRAAVAARKSANFQIIARTDARATLGLDEAVARANAALAVGADMVFVEAPLTLEEMASIPKSVTGPCMLNLVPGGRTPIVSLADAQAMGFKLVILPGMLLREIIPALDEALRQYRRTGVPNAAPPGAGVAEAFRRFGADEWNALRRTYDGAGQ
jgi:2-methylisocitrate lyase-like PEP mutase family enzyme